VRVLIATDAAGEGVNLQNANLMVNYDLPWNPNRLEQRFGRIHRIGQTEVCHLWNLVAKETREGEVYHRLLEKLARRGEALKGRVFDILGEVFEEHSLRTCSSTPSATATSPRSAPACTPAWTGAWTAPTSRTSSNATPSRRET
jgi:superfamily II DNA/RNA helicase